MMETQKKRKIDKKIADDYRYISISLSDCKFH